MRTLRVLLASPPAADSAHAWALVDADERVLDEGRGPLAQWPAAARREAVLASGAVRMLALALPPLPADRLQAAVTYALEARLATPPEAALIVAGPQATDGVVRALVVDRALVRAVLAHAPRFDRVLAEPQGVAAPGAQAWRWCADAEHGFVVTAKGESFAAALAPGAALPPELALALEQAARAGQAPLEVVASVPQAKAHADGWARASGVAFVAGPRWHWATGDAKAPDLAAAFARALAPAASPNERRPSFALAAGIAIAAVALHVVATAGTWSWRKLELARTRDAIAAIARTAGAEDAAALARRHAAAHHGRGRYIAGDAWPQLAQAAPALAALAPGTLRSARFGGGAWTVELGPLDDASLAAFEARLRSAGVAAVAARHGGGVRVRLEGAS